MNKEFIKLNKNELINMFDERFKELTEQAVLEQLPEKKIKLLEMAYENKNWIMTIKNIDSPVNNKEFTGV